MAQEQRNIEAEIEELVRRWKRGAQCSAIEPLTPDASLRRYFRVYLKGVEVESLVAMVFDSVACPEASGTRAIDSDTASVELTQFFSENNISVPELYEDAREKGILLIEDLGDTSLASLVLAPHSDRDDSLVFEYYKQAIDEILRIQQISMRPGFFAFERRFTPEIYVREMSETVDYLLRPRALLESQIKVVERGIEQLAQDLADMPQVLVHRDFHSWNLFVCQSRVRVIDFQDALLGTRSYDVASLLNDRDTDTALGQDLHERLLGHFTGLFADSSELRAEYSRVLLQRDLKVAGRFQKLASGRGLKRYEQWIPGTLRRVGQSLKRVAIESEEPVYREALTVLADVLDDVRQGADALS